MTTAALRPRDERRRATEARLLDAALGVFRERGYDAATTGEMARLAGVAAGTFYLHFRDKRAAFEALAHRAAHDLLATWRAALRPAMSALDAVSLGLQLAADFWRAEPDLTRLLLEGGPSLGNLGHLRLVDEIATTLADRALPESTTPRALALLLAGLGIEMGRVVAAKPAAASGLDELLRLAQRLVSAPEPRTSMSAPGVPRGDGEGGRAHRRPRRRVRR
jgi:AcrR family transcriptional regulator